MFFNHVVFTGSGILERNEYNKTRYFYCWTRGLRGDVILSRLDNLSNRILSHFVHAECENTYST